MVKEFFLESPMGLPYSYKYYGYDSYQVILDELEEQNQVHCDDYYIFFKKRQDLIYTYEDGRVVLFMGGSLLLFEPRSYSIWLSLDGALERAIRSFQVVEVESKKLGVFRAFNISNFVAEVVLEIATKFVDIVEEGMEIYQTPNNWLVIQDFIKEVDYVVFEEEARQLFGGGLE